MMARCVPNFFLAGRTDSKRSAYTRTTAIGKDEGRFLGDATVRGGVECRFPFLTTGHWQETRQAAQGRVPRRQFSEATGYTPPQLAQKARYDYPQEVYKQFIFAIAEMKNRPKADFSTLKLPDFLLKFGRRDWTRTNDPHHVKVML